MFGWGKKQKQPPKKPRPAPPAHRHPQQARQQPQQLRKPSNRASAAGPPRQQTVNNASPTQRAAVKPQAPPSQPADDDDDEEDDMFAGMEVDDDEDADDNAAAPQPQRNRTYSVEELASMTEEQQMAFALQLSLGSKQAAQSSKHAAQQPPPVASKPISKPAQQAQPPPPPVDKANIQWPSIPDNEPEQTAESNANTGTSAFGFDLSGSGGGAPQLDAAIIDPSPMGTSSAFGFDLSGGALHNNNDEMKNSHGDEEDDHDAVNNAEEEDSMFGGMNLVKDDDVDDIPGATSFSSKATATPSHTSSKYSQSPPPLSGSSQDHSVSAQLKRAEQQHERSRKRIWSQIKQCIEREQRIKQREAELNQNLQEELRKKSEAETAKKIALQNANFEEAEKTKNTIRRAMKNIQDINHSLTKCHMDSKKIVSDKTQQEEVYMTKSKAYREKLDVLYSKHEEVMSKQIEEEFKRIEREEKIFKEKLERSEREIQLDDERIERCKDRLEEIEDKIKSDVEPFQESLDSKTRDKTALEMEIEELNKQLMLKQEELQTVEQDIDALNNEIQTVRHQYKTQMDEVQDEQSRYEQSKQKFNLQKNEFVVTLNGLSEDEEKNRTAEEELETELSGLKLKIAKINESFERFEEKQLRQNEWSREEQNLLDNQVKLNKKLDNIKYEIEKFEKELKQIDSKCTHHRQTIATIDSALPILHSDKQTAVNNENYLEAGKIHKQIQHKEQQKDKSLQSLKELNEKGDDIKTKLREKQTQDVQLKQQLDDIKIKLHEKRFQLIMDHRICIKESLEELNNDDEDAQRDDVEQVVLNLELQQIEDELKFFNQTYGWNTEYKHKPKVTKTVAIVESDNDDAADDELLNMSPNHVGNQDELLISPKTEEVENEEEHKEADDAKPRSKQEISDEIKRLRAEIVNKESEKEEIQDKINEAVANDQFHVAGQFAPKKKQLISEANELKSKVEKLEAELLSAIEYESMQQQQEDDEEVEEEEQVDETTTAEHGQEEAAPHTEIEAMENGGTQAEEKTDSPAQEDDDMTMESILNSADAKTEDANMGHNGVALPTDDKEENHVNAVTENNVMDKLGADNQEEDTEAAQANKSKTPPNIEENEDHEEGDDMFGDMDLVDGDTVNID